MATSKTHQHAEASGNEHRGRSLLFIGVGFLLFIAFQVAINLIPRGLSEFVYLSNTYKTLWFSPLYGFTVEQATSRALELLLGTPALLLLATGISSFLQPRSLSPTVVGRAAAAAIAGVLFVGWTVFGLYRGRALVDDELTYSLQAQLLSEGALGFRRAPVRIIEPFLIVAKSGITGKEVSPCNQVLEVFYRLPRGIYPRRPIIESTAAKLGLLHA